MAEGAIGPGRPTTQAAVSAFLHGRMDGDPGVKVSLTGSHRTLPPETTVERIQPLVGAMGITRCANVTDLDRVGIPVTMVVRPNSRSIAVSQGKGLTLASAKASGLMEAIETYHAERITKPLRFGSETDLRAEMPMVDLERVARVADDDYEARRRMLWIEGQDLLGDGPLWLPYETVHANYTLPLPPGSGCFQASTNGLASGNHILEAICHGLCEVIERDASTLWELGSPEQRHRSRVDLASIDDLDCRAVLERFDAAGLETAIWEITSDVGIPTFQCMIVDRRKSLGHSGLGAGCHPDRAIALMRALLEAAQVRLTYIAGSRDDLSAEEFSDAAIAQKAEQAEALMANGSYQRRYAEAPTSRHETFAQDVGHILDRLQSAGINQVALIDISPPGTVFSVVRLVVPGLEAPNDDEGYVPGPRARASQGGSTKVGSRPRAPTRRLTFRRLPGEDGNGA